MRSAEITALTNRRMSTPLTWALTALRSTARWAESRSIDLGALSAVCRSQTIRLKASPAKQQANSHLKIALILKSPCSARSIKVTWESGCVVSTRVASNQEKVIAL